jgi:glycine/D-amino acid oxidase-like deaminating enzyme
MVPPSAVVIGAGIVGCLVAHELAVRDPEMLITVLDRDAIGAGASRRSAGLHLCRGGTPRKRAMSASSHAFYSDLLARQPGLPIYPLDAIVITGTGQGGEPGGSYLDTAAPIPAGRWPIAGRAAGDATGDRPASDATDSAPAGDHPAGDTTSGAPVDGKPAGDAADSAPAGDLPDGGVDSDIQISGPLGGMISVPPGSAAWRIAGSHYADVYGVTQAIAAGLRPRVRFAEGVAVTGLTSGPDAVTVVCGTGERLVADAAVLAPGPWLAAPAWGDLLAPLGLRVKKIVALHIEQRPDPAEAAVIFDVEDAFLLPLAYRGHWLFSYTCREWDVDPDGLASGLSAANIDAARDCLRRYSPALARACDAGRVFCDAYSPDTEPRVRALDAHGRIVFAGAASGSGYRLGPAIGCQAADLLLGRLGAAAGARPAERRSHQ